MCFISWSTRLHQSPDPSPAAPSSTASKLHQRHSSLIPVHPSSTASPGLASPASSCPISDPRTAGSSNRKPAPPSPCIAAVSSSSLPRSSTPSWPAATAATARLTPSFSPRARLAQHVRMAALASAGFLCPLLRCRASARLQIAADLRTFTFCSSPVRLNAHENDSFSFFQFNLFCSA
jgi:hypothetical protein